jgi:hypothetical protein
MRSHLFELHPFAWSKIENATRSVGGEGFGQVITQRTNDRVACGREIRLADIAAVREGTNAVITPRIQS